MKNKSIDILTKWNQIFMFKNLTINHFHYHYHYQIIISSSINQLILFQICDKTKSGNWAGKAFDPKSILLYSCLYVCGKRREQIVSHWCEWWDWIKRVKLWAAKTTSWEMLKCPVKLRGTAELGDNSLLTSYVIHSKNTDSLPNENVLLKH